MSSIEKVSVLAIGIDEKTIHQEFLATHISIVSYPMEKSEKRMELLRVMELRRL